MSEDDDLFSQEMAGVQPLASDKRVVYLKNSVAGHKVSADPESEIRENPLTTGFLNIQPCDDPLEYKHDGVQQGVLDKLRQGKYPLEASLNLLSSAVRNCLPFSVRHRLKIYAPC